jgi:hypothetical protein
VALDKKWGAPSVIDDGVTIAKDIELPETFENMGVQLVKEAASKTNDACGDGTTTSTILAHAIITGGFKNVAAGADALALKCGIQMATAKIIEELKKDASSYWRGRSWIIECESDQRAQPRVRTDFAAELTIKASCYSPTYCVLHGRCMVLSETGMLIVVADFRESYFQDITSAYRFGEVTISKPAGELPSPLTGRIVGVRFRPDELPQCRIGITFEGLSKEATEMVRRYVQEHSQAGPADTGEGVPRIDTTTSGP